MIFSSNYIHIDYEEEKMEKMRSNKRWQVWDNERHEIVSFDSILHHFWKSLLCLLLFAMCMNACYVQNTFHNYRKRCSSRSLPYTNQDHKSLNLLDKNCFEKNSSTQSNFCTLLFFQSENGNWYRDIGDMHIYAKTLWIMSVVKL